MHLPTKLGATLAVVVFLLAAWPLVSQASEQVAIDKGCYNCHGANLRGDAPAFDRLSARLSRLKGDAAAEQKFVDEYRAGALFQHIAPHERLTPESARALIHWLVEGAK